MFLSKPLRRRSSEPLRRAAESRVRRHGRRGGFVAPLPLLVLFGAFVAAIVYLVAASLARRTAPEYAPSPASRVRGGRWREVGDTLTVDASDGSRWTYVSLARGVVVGGADTASADIAVQRYRVITMPNGAIADLGVVPFARAYARPSAAFVATTRVDQPENAAIKHWYRYNLLTHLLERSGHVYAIRSPSGALWKLEILSYYCPQLEAGCLTVRYAPLAPAR